MTTKRDVKRPDAKLVPAYPQCGTCPYALIDGKRADGGDQLWCHGAPPSAWPVGTGTGGGYPPRNADSLGCKDHPLWPAELRKPFLNGRPKPQ